MDGWDVRTKLFVAFGVLLLVGIVVLSYGLLFTLLMSERRRRRRNMQRRRARREMVSDEYAIVVPNQLFTAEIEVMAPEMVYLALDDDKETGDEEDPETCENSDIEVSCAVCLDDIQDGDLIRSLPCNHEFHSSCITAWLRKCARCPLCNLSMERKKMVDMQLGHVEPARPWRVGSDS